MVLHAAGRDLKMTGCKIGPVTISIGSQAYPNVEVYVAPIKDDMLLGLDFFHQQKTIIDLNDGKLDIGQERITNYNYNALMVVAMNCFKSLM